MDPRKLSTGAHLVRVSLIGLNFVISILVGLALGWGVQQLWHWGHWVIIVGILLGIVTGYYLLFDDLRKLNAQSEKGFRK
jgi:F0F1-type ATP synthase assembly protein I